MNVLELFAGAGGGILASQLLGHRVVCAVEIDPYCREVLLRRQEEGHLEPFPIWDDVRSFDGRMWRGKVDVVAGGFPCQPFSTASRGRVIAIDLFGECERIISEVQPRWILLENVSPEAFRGLPHDEICASGLGAPHERRRYWLLAHRDDTGDPAKSFNAEVACLSAARGSDPWSEGPDRFLGMDDGLASPRMDRLRALGNGQVPRVAQEAWRR